MKVLQGSEQIAYDCGKQRCVKRGSGALDTQGVAQGGCWARGEVIREGTSVASAAPDEEGLGVSKVLAEKLGPMRGCVLRAGV